MSEPFLGQLSIVSFNFPPKGWAQCNGQLLPIQQNQALFSLLGTVYGGNGSVTFALPDLRGRVPVHFGDGVSLGAKFGVESQSLSVNEMPAHQHGAGTTAEARKCSSGVGTSNVAVGHFPAVASRPLYADVANGNLGSAASGTNGGGQNHENMQPFLTLNMIIALQGIFPSRN